MARFSVTRFRLSIFLALLLGLAVAECALAQSHPNGLSTVAQIDAARAHIIAGDQPMLRGYGELQENVALAMNYTVSVPSSLVLGCFWDDPTLFKSIAASIHDSGEYAYALALMYNLNVSLTTNQRNQYGNKAIQLMNAWPQNNTEFVNACASPLPEASSIFHAAELMLSSPLWAPADITAFKNWAHNTAYDFCRFGEAGGDLSLWPPLYNDDREWPSTTDQGIFGSECVLAIDKVTDDTARYATDLQRLITMMDMQLFPSCAGDACETLPGQSGWNPPASLHYYAYWLIPLMRAGMHAKNNGTDIWTRVPPVTSGHPSGQALDALNFLFNRKDNWPHPNQENTFDRVRSGESSDYGPDIYWIAGNVYDNATWRDWASYVNDPFAAGMHWIQMMIITPAPAGGAPPPPPPPPPPPTGLAYWVSQTLGGTGNCTTAHSDTPPANYLRSIRAAANCMSGGETMIIRSGTYNERMTYSSSFPWRNGSPGNYTRYTAYTGDPKWSVVIHPTSGRDHVISTFQQQWISIEGLKVDATTDSTGYNHPGTGGRNDYLNETATNISPMKPESSDNLRIMDNEIFGSQDVPSGNCLQPGGGNLLISGNYIHDCIEYGIYGPGPDSIVENNIFEFNGGYGMHVYDGTEGRNVGGCGGADNLIVRNNIFHGNGLFSYDINSVRFTTPAIILSSACNNKMYNNVLYGNNSGLEIWSSFTSVYGNTFYNNSGYGCILNGPYSANGTIARNNICYGSADNAIRVDSGSVTQSDNLLGTDPFFVAAAGGNFRIGSAGSPAVSPPGFTLGAPYNVDIEGVTRPPGQYTIGAYQFTAAAAPSFTFTAPTSVPSGTAPTLTWSAVTSNGTGLNCSASVPSGGPDTNWTGTTSGQLIAGNLGGKLGATMTAPRTYRMACTDSNGPTTIDRVVTVVAACSRVVYDNGGVRWSLPGTLEAENFDTCSNLGTGVTGEGTTHHDFDASNNGGSYRLNEDVDIEATPSLPSGQNVGYIRATEWLEYSVNFTSSGTFSFTNDVSYNDPGAGGTFHLSIDGTTIGSTMSIPNTANWTVYTPVVTSANVTSGNHILRVTFDANGNSGADIYAGNMDRIIVAFTGATPTADFTGTPLTGTVPLAVTFTDASSGTITSRAWTFGDGTTSTATSPSHTYTTAGPYTVQLTVTGPGGSNTQTRPNYVTVNPPGLLGAIVKHTFEEGSGTTAADSSGNPTPHPCTMNTAGWTTGIIGNFGMNADGTRECHFTSTADTRPAHPGMSVWVRCPANAGYSYAGDMGGAWGLWFDPSGQPHIYVNTATGVVGATAAVNVFTNTAHMLSWTLDNTGLRLWIDAAQPPSGFTATTAAPIYSGSEVFYWGRNGVNNNDYLNGCVVDQGYLFDTPLTQADVTAHYNEAQTGSGMSTTHMRVYSDAVEGAPLNAVDTNLTITIGTIVGLRYAIRNVGTTIFEYFPLWCARNGGSQTKVTNSFASLGLRIADSAFVNMGDLTTVPLPNPNDLPLDGFAPIRGRFVADVIDPTLRTNIASGQHTEWEYRVEMGSPATAGDTFVCQPRREADTVFDTYNNLKVISLQGISPPSSVRVGGTEIGGSR